MKRVLTAVILAPVIAWVVLIGPAPVFLAVLIAVAVLCFYEYSGIVAHYGIERPGPVGYAAGLIVLLTPWQPLLSLTLLTLLALSMMAWGEATFDQGLRRAAALILGILYIFGAWRTALGLRSESPYLLLFALAITWAGDIAAYYVGKSLGRHKLAPKVSPAKSWEGAAASFVASMIFGYIYLNALVPGLPPAEILALAGVGNVVGQMGDLSESALKRGAGVKDSGTLLPGHGGWLDRVDSSLFTVPVIYALLFLPWGA